MQAELLFWLQFFNLVATSMGVVPLQYAVLISMAFMFIGLVAR